MSEQDRVERLSAKLREAAKDRSGRTQQSLLKELREQYKDFFAGLEALPAAVASSAPAISVQTSTVATHLLEERIAFAVLIHEIGSPFLTVDVDVNTSVIAMSVKAVGDRVAVDLGVHPASEQNRALDILYDHVGERVQERLRTGR